MGLDFHVAAVVKRIDAAEKARQLQVSLVNESLTHPYSYQLEN
jgi:hypothetical protein